MNDLEKVQNARGEQIGTVARMVAIVVGSLHQQELLDGKAVARSIRLDEGSVESLRMSTADLIDRIVAKVDDEGPLDLRPVD